MYPESEWNLSDRSSPSLPCSSDTPEKRLRQRSFHRDSPQPRPSARFLCLFRSLRRAFECALRGSDLQSPVAVVRLRQLLPLHTLQLEYRFAFLGLGKSRLLRGRELPLIQRFEIMVPDDALGFAAISDEVCFPRIVRRAVEERNGPADQAFPAYAKRSERVRLPRACPTMAASSFSLNPCIASPCRARMWSVCRRCSSCRVPCLGPEFGAAPSLALRRHRRRPLSGRRPVDLLPAGILPARPGPCGNVAPSGATSLRYDKPHGSSSPSRPSPDQSRSSNMSAGIRTASPFPTITCATLRTAGCASRGKTIAAIVAKRGWPPIGSASMGGGGNCATPKFRSPARGSARSCA